MSRLPLIPQVIALRKNFFHLPRAFRKRMREQTTTMKTDHSVQPDNEPTDAILLTSSLPAVQIK
jgi:hypothetical protein